MTPLTIDNNRVENGGTFTINRRYILTHNSSIAPILWLRSSITGIFIFWKKCRRFPNFPVSTVKYPIGISNIFKVSQTSTMHSLRKKSESSVFIYEFRNRATNISMATVQIKHASEWFSAMIDLSPQFMPRFDVLLCLQNNPTWPPDKANVNIASCCNQDLTSLAIQPFGFKNADVSSIMSGCWMFA